MFRIDEILLAIAWNSSLDSRIVIQLLACSLSTAIRSVLYKIKFVNKMVNKYDAMSALTRCDYHSSCGLPLSSRGDAHTKEALDRCRRIKSRPRDVM